MWPAIVIGGGLSYLFSQVLRGDEPPKRWTPPHARPGLPQAPYPPAQQASQLVGGPAGAPQPQPQPGAFTIDAHCEPKTRAGLERLLMGGSPEDLDRASHSLLRTGYPLAAQACAMKAVQMRRFDEERVRATAARERLLAAQAQATQNFQAQQAQQQSLADAAAQMHALAAQKLPTPSQAGLDPAPQNGVHAAAVPGTLPDKVSLPGSVQAPPSSASGEAPVSEPVVKRGRGRPRHAPVVKDASTGVVSEVEMDSSVHAPLTHANGRANPEH